MAKAPDQPTDEELFEAATPTPDAPKKKAKEDTRTELQRTIDDIHTQTKVNTTVVCADLVPLFNHVSTGPFILDYALFGGIMEGLATEIYGVESSGKSTLCLRIAASLQAKHPDKVVVWIDAESTFDAAWVVKHGVDLQRLYVVRPESGEQAVDVIVGLMDAWEVSGVVIDSVPSLIPQVIIEQSVVDKTMGQLAALIGTLCGKILMSWNKERARGHWVTVVFINQWRASLKFMGPERGLPGGKQLQYLVSTKIDLRNKVIEGTDEYGQKITNHNEHTFLIQKWKGGNSLKTGKFDMIVNPHHRYPVGTFDDFATVATYAKKLGYITGGGASWRIRDIDQKFRKLDDIVSFLFEEEGEYLRLKQRLIAQNRFDKGLQPLPPDGFLLDWNAVDNIDMTALTQVVKEIPDPEVVASPPEETAQPPRRTARTPE